MTFALPHIQALKAYSPPLAGRMNYKGSLLDFNERTVPPSPKVLCALRDFSAEGKVHCYPEYPNLCGEIAKYAGATESEVLITNGSDHGIELIFRTFTEKNSQVCIPAPSFAMFFQCAGVVGNQIISPEYDCAQDCSFPFSEIMEKVTAETKLIVICNPNNPTGTTLSLEEIEMVLQKVPQAIVYVDEAYYEFSKVTAAPLLQKYSNLIITRTFSKAFGLPSLRIGYVLSNAQNIAEILKVRGPYDVNMCAAVAASAALKDTADLKKYVTEVMGVSKPLLENFLRAQKIQFFSSVANFLLLQMENIPQMAEILKENGILVRPQKSPLLKNAFRLTIGTKAQTEQCITVFKKFL